MIYQTGLMAESCEELTLDRILSEIEIVPVEE